jgi:hypothetical protein
MEEMNNSVNPSNIYIYRQQKPKIRVMGGLGKSARRDRDPDRILDRKGLIFAIPAHASTDQPMVIKKW